MAILNILTEEDPTLRRISRKVDEITPRIITLLDDMKDTLHKANGCGLAAPQVGVLRRVVIVEVEEGKLIELINPEIVKTSGKQNEIEGCLSLPHKWGVTDRPMKVTVKYTGLDGKEHKVSGSELYARAFCHELDHLDGVLFTDNVVRMLDPDEIEN